MMRNVIAKLKQFEWKTNGLMTPVITVLVAIMLPTFIVCMFSRTVTEVLVYSRGQSLELWRWLSYGLSHADPWHFVWNMFALILLGGKVEQLLGHGKFIMLIALSIIAGAAGHTAAGPGPVMGFSGALFAILVIFAASYPKVRLFFWVPAWLIAVVLIGVNTLLFIQDLVSTGSRNISYAAHLGGAALGAVWFWGGPTIARIQGQISDKRSEVKERREELDQEKIDNLLAKVSASGLPSLTPTERKFLEQYSQRQQKK